MALTIKNRLVVPFTDKDPLKVIFGDSQTFEFTLPSPHQAGDAYHLGIDQDRVVYPPSRPLCAYSTAFTVADGVLTMTLKYNTSRLREFVCGLKKPTPVCIQLVRVRNGVADTLLLDTLLALPSVLDSANTVCEGDPLAELLNAKLDKPAVEGTAGQVLSLDEDGQTVWRDEQEIPEQEQADWTEDDTTSPSYIKNKPDLSVYAEKSELATVATTGSYDDLSNTPDLSVYAEKSELAPVAISGDYADLSNKPAIPTKVSDLTNDSDYQTGSQVQTALLPYSLVTETGARLSMTVDSNYDLVVSLLDKNGNVLSTQDVDLPVESMVVSASYADGTLTLTLQNGQTLDVDISDIVSGLVPESRTVNGHALSQDVTVTASDLGLATVATTGSYNDLADQPTLPTSDQLLPASTSSDAGKVLTVDTNGDAEWAEASAEVPDATDYLCFMAAQANSTVKLNKSNASMADLDMEYSTDKETWTQYTWESGATAGAVITLANAGDRVFFRGDNATFSTDGNTHYVFGFSGTLYASGNIMSLLDKKCLSLTIPNAWCFNNLFNGGYSWGGAHLLSAPRLPATKLADSCYARMFYRQDKITEMPELPATELPYNCYYSMFNETGITEVELKPETIGTRSFGEMFYACQNLKKVKVNFTSFGTDGWGNTATNNWLYGVSSTGIFECPSVLDTSTRDASHVPAGWIIVRTDAPQSNWDETDSTEASYIRNKPTIPSTSDINTLIADALTMHNN